MELNLGDFALGVVTGIAIGLALTGLAAKITSMLKSPKKKKKGQGDGGRQQVPSDPPTREIFTTHIDKTDVRRGMTISVASHLRDVVQESSETGRLGHQLRLVIKGYDGDGPLDQIDDLVRHCVKTHEACPHLPFWLDDESVEEYLKLVYRGEQVVASEVDPEKAIVSWGKLQDDIATRSSAAITKDMGEAADGTVLRLVGEGMTRIRRIIGKLDPMHQEVDEDAEVGSY